MSRIQLISGPAVEESFQDADVRRVFHYQLNPATIGVLLLVGLLFFIGAGVLWFGPGLGGGYTVGFVLAILMGMSFFSMASFWENFRQKHFIAVSDDYLFVGQKEQAWRIHWSLVDRETLNLEDLQMSRFQGKMSLHSGGQDIDIPLFTPFVFLEDIEGLMFELLQRLETDGGEAPVGALDEKEDSPHDQQESHTTGN